MAGGGTGGHVVPSVAVARELKSRGHDVLFIGTRNGLEAKIVPAAGFPIEWIEIGGLKRVGAAQTARTLLQLPLSVVQVLRLFARHRPAGVFSMGGYVAGPVIVSASLRRVPVIAMEPNAMPGLTNRRSGRFLRRVLVSFEEAQRYFPPGKSELTGLPVRPEFFALPEKPAGEVLTVLVTGGSRGSRTLNQACEASWPMFQKVGLRVCWIHQTGSDAHAELARKFAASGLEGEVVPFLADMPEAFSRADLIVCRSGAGAVAELAAAGKPSILVPFPYAADQHQLKNAEAMQRQQAARLVLDKEMSGERLFQEVQSLAANRAALAEMGRRARSMARPGAASRAADLLEEFAGGPTR